MRALVAVLLLALPGAAALNWSDTPERLVVGFDRAVGPADLRELHARGAEVLRAPPGADFVAVRGSQALRDVPGVRYLEPDPALIRDDAPNDLHWDDLGPWPGQWGPKAIGAEAAWGLTTGSSDVVLAILDDGVDWLHPDLVGNRWVNEDEVPGNGLDDDGNGYVDDVHGWDCASNDNDVRPDPGDTHGTHVAGIAAARRDNVLGIAGVAQVRLMALKVFGFEATASAAAECLRYAAANGARVAGMSWGTSPLTALDEAIADAWAGGVVLVKSAGNKPGGTAPCPVTYPGTRPEVIAVSALDPPGDALAGYSCTGAKVELAAPGTLVLSTLALGAVDFGSLPGRLPGPPLFGYLSGTSMSQPHVAGVAALMLSANPALTNQQVRAILGATAEDLGPAGRDPQFGFGRVDAHGAVLAALP